VCDGKKLEGGGGGGEWGPDMRKWWKSFLYLGRVAMRERGGERFDRNIISLNKCSLNSKRGKIEKASQGEEVWSGGPRVSTP